MSDPIGAVAQRIAQVGLDIGDRKISFLGESNGVSFGDTLKKALNEVSGAQDNATVFQSAKSMLRRAIDI